MLLVLSAVISAAKQAANSLTPTDLKQCENDKRHNVRRIFTLMQKSEKLTATMQVAHVFVNVSFVIIVFLFASNNLPIGIITIIILMIITALLFFADFIPGKYASQNALKVLSRSSLLLSILQIAFYPLTVTLLWLSKTLNKKQSISIDDLSDALEKTTETSENKKILKGIVKFGRIDVHTIMTPRMDVESADVTAKMSELIAQINEWGYSRIPVYDDTPDNVKGILYVKDLLPHIGESDDFQWQSLIRNAYFVPEHKKIDDLLKEFQEMKNHMAVIIDEYGGMVGIVTLEDILEEIVGDIADESDDDEQDYVKIDECTYLFDGKVLLKDFFRIMRINEADFDAVKGEADTLAGVILEMKGEIPQKGDCTDYMGLSFYVESVDNRRIKQIKVVINANNERPPQSLV